MIQNGCPSKFENRFRSVTKEQHEAAWIIKAQIAVAAMGILLSGSHIVWKLFFRD